ncbi:MAG: deoxyuridine 5'-triphosphate nucleotidohydrolase [Candidatus Aenigmarchaeota archaeon]|nr:deoxyuridine 5'-triphosphate nucleotidohydrolase [Candidatus Aenigmarchaeota archaeon]
MILSHKDIEKLIKERNLIEDYVDLKAQLQPAGFDFTLSKVFEIENFGKLDFTNEERSIPEKKELKFDEGWLKLSKGSYLVMFNEVVNIPEDVVMVVKPRSSLVRMGATLHTALWDPGYSGRSICLLTVFNDNGILLKKNARIAQGIFLKVLTTPEKLYDGIFKNENVEE